MEEKKLELKDSNINQLFDKNVKRNENGFPLLEDGSIDWELTSKEKEEQLFSLEKLMKLRGGRKIKSSKGKYPSNYTPPKKKRKK